MKRKFSTEEKAKKYCQDIYDHCDGIKVSYEKQLIDGKELWVVSHSKNVGRMVDCYVRGYVDATKDIYSRFKKKEATNEKEGLSSSEESTK